MNQRSTTPERDALKRLVARYERSSTGYRPGVQYPTKYADGWHNGFVTALAEASLIAREGLDPEGFAAEEEQWRAGFTVSDREWLERTGCCGHCGMLAKFCTCPPDDPCDCGPHEISTDPAPCWHCGGTGEVNPRAIEKAGADA